MPLSVGARLGPYEIAGFVGAGGMGEVYRARDPRLGRDVAIKVLPPAFSADPDRLHRFEQEARAAAALNHPNILAVYDIGQHDNAPYIVSELLEGETLRERLGQAPATSRGVGVPASEQNPLSVRNAVDYAVQVCRGLAAAHEKGITHRDLKPENLFLTTDGRVKILDFGLAKLTEAALADSSAVPTAAPDTLPGLMLGTVGYMAPEQVRGADADHRADIFAFGAILYEMLSGHRAFRGATTVDTISAILKEDPPELPMAARHIPPGLVRIIDRCLKKSPSARFQTASDLAFALEALSSPADRAEVSGAIATVPVRRSRERLAWTLVAVFAVVLVAVLALGALRYLQRAPTDTRVYRSSILPPANTGISDTAVVARRLALSPDGRRLAFTAAGSDGRVLLWVRPLDGLVAEPLAGTEGAFGPFWSPDSRFLGFFAADGKLKKIDAAGGPPETLCDFSAQPAGATWNRDDVILFATMVGSESGSIRRVSASGGASSIVATPDPESGETEYWFPFFLPDGQHFLYLALGAPLRPLGIYVASLNSKERKLLVRGGSNVQYAQGYLIFPRETTLMAQAFDVGGLELRGDAVPIVEPVLISGTLGVGGGTGAFSVSDTGVLAYQAGSGEPRGQLTWFDRTGKQIGVLGDQGAYTDVAMSPDGTRVAVSLFDPTSRSRDIWVYDVVRGGRTRFTFDPADDLTSWWSADGGQVIFNSSRKGRLDLYHKSSSGAGADDVFVEEGNFDKYPYGWTPDGRFFLYASGLSTPGTGNDLWVLPTFGDRKPFVFLKTPFNEGFARFSPDGRWVAYVSNESRRNEVYVTPFPTPSGKWQISTTGGGLPRWRRDGKEIFYVASNNELMTVEVNGQGAGLEVGAARPLFQTRPGGARYIYDVSADGQRFLVNTAVEEQQTPSPPITVVVNWPALLDK